MTNVQCKIGQLQLDQQNPRYPVTGSQRDAMRAIIDEQGDKLFRLAESIAKLGLNPLERLLVTKSDRPKGFIVLEGNRRLTVLKIFANPNIISDIEMASGLRKRLEGLASNFDINDVEPIACFVAPDRATGASWIRLKHTGENGGRGVVSWTGLQSARFRGGDPASQALDFVAKYGDLTDEERDLLDINFPITTLDRLLAAVPIRKRLGINIDRNKLTSSLPAEELIKPLKKMVLDLGGGKINVSGLKKADDQKSYIDKFARADLPDLSKAGDFTRVEEIERHQPQTLAIPKKSRRSIPDPSNRSTAVPKGMKLNVTNSKISKILTELRGLKVEKYQNAVAVLTRVFLELSIDHYLQKKGSSTQFKDPNNGQKRNKTLKAKVTETINLLVNEDGHDARDLRPVERAINRDGSPLHMDLLHDYVHNKFSQPRERDLLTAWDECSPLYESIWK